LEYEFFRQVGIQFHEKVILRDDFAPPLFAHQVQPETACRNPLQLDSRSPTLPFEKYIYYESRYTMLMNSDQGAANDCSNALNTT